MLLRRIMYHGTNSRYVAEMISEYGAYRQRSHQVDLTDCANLAANYAVRNSRNRLDTKPVVLVIDTGLVTAHFSENRFGYCCAQYIDVVAFSALDVKVIDNRGLLEDKVIRCFDAISELFDEPILRKVL